MENEPTIAELTQSGFALALERLQAGGLVAFPTETVYGLGADATNDSAVAALYAAKGRPKFNPLIAHVADLEAALRLGRFDDAALRLAGAFWPGPLTLVVERSPDCAVSLLATAGLDTIAIRVPAHGVAHTLLSAAQTPLVAPSANRSGHVSPTEAAHVVADFPHKDLLVLDGGAAALGLESTIINASSGNLELLRPGALDRHDIEAVAGPLQLAQNSERPSAPGQLASHYAPRLPVALNIVAPEPGDVLLAFGSTPQAQTKAVLTLSSTGDLTEAAANLFRQLRAADKIDASRIAIMPIPNQGLGEAINDRLARAAAPRTS